MLNGPLDDPTHNSIFDAIACTTTTIAHSHHAQVLPLPLGESLVTARCEVSELHIILRYLLML